MQVVKSYKVYGVAIGLEDEKGGIVDKAGVYVDKFQKDVWFAAIGYTKTKASDQPKRR